jgi:hypothetical protein
MLIMMPWSLQRAGEVVAGELTALVGIEDLGPAVSGERLLERLDAKIGAERVRQPPRQHRAAHPQGKGSPWPSGCR